MKYQSLALAIPKMLAASPVIQVLLIALGISILCHFSFKTASAQVPPTHPGPVFGYELDGQDVILKLLSYNGQTGRLPSELGLMVANKTVKQAADCGDTPTLNKMPADITPVRVNHAPSQLSRLPYKNYYNKRIPCFEILLIYPFPVAQKFFQTAPRWNVSSPAPEANTEFALMPKTSFTLQDVLAIFRLQLTPEGQALMDITNFETVKHGCHGADAHQGIAGCWVIESSTVYINQDIFSADYNYLNQAPDTQMAIIKQAVDILMHEFMHATDSHLANQHPSMSAAVAACYTSEGIAYKKGHQRLPKAVEECLHSFPYWGQITRAIKTLYLDEAKKALKHLSSHAVTIEGRLWSAGVETFSLGWYTELYAELPTFAYFLPQILKDHYGRYLKDQVEFATIMNNQADFNLILEDRIHAVFLEAVKEEDYNKPQEALKDYNMVSSQVATEADEVGLDP